MQRHQRAGEWEHMHDYDASFEKLADAVDAAHRALAHGQRGGWMGPDLRMRCTTTDAVYTWPECAPYDKRATIAWNVTGCGSHAADPDDGPRALCGFRWTEQEGRIIDGLPDCGECRREVQLGAVRDPGTW
ncbi:hypothetical protein BIV57_04365 [Mangrovactinospora gilvigrisea]|uniref:Uncharacterized protein n=2 Tax=Mangrovactinospora gilvigrisea TaxID=1428644 RepID=A0A1J7BJ77_9ACTN|nr:hypothetical protein BIV57_04365 [Mangrovactinospora gilvigrisea]